MTNMIATPSVENRNEVECSFCSWPVRIQIAPRLARAVSANDHAGGEQQNPISDRKKTRSRESSTPRLEAVKMRHHAERGDALHQPRAGPLLEHVCVTGGQPARIRNRQITTDRMKLMTWLRVMAEVMQATAR